MSRVQILSALLLTQLICVYGEEITAQPKIDEFLRPPPFSDKLPNNPAQEQSYISRLTSWLFPFGGSAKEQPPVVHQQRPVRQPHLPPATNQKENCNPCNREPWIPVVSNHGKNTVIGFLPPAQANAPLVYEPPHKNIQPAIQINQPSNIQYGLLPPRQLPTPNLHRPTTPIKEYGPSINNQYGPPVKPPGLPQRVKSQIPEFIVPPVPAGAYRPPRFNYGSPPSPSKLPLLPNHNPPPPAKYNPAQSGVIAPFPTSSQAISSSFVAPPSASPFKYAPPVIHTPNSHLNEFISPPHVQVGAYDQSVISNIPTSHSEINFFPTIPSSNYGSTPLEKPFTPTSSSVHIQKPHATEEITLTFNLPPDHYPRQPQIPNIPHYNNQLSSGKYHGKVVNSYGPPPAGPVTNSGLKVTSEEYLPPKEQLPLATAPGATTGAVYVPPNPQHNHQRPLEPIPFPNMSPSFILPIHKAQPFRSSKNVAPNINSFNHINAQGPKQQISPKNPPLNTHNNQGADVQIIKSVPVANFLSTIEYPPKVIQSPIIDLSVSDNNIVNQEPDHSNEGNIKINLSENPIIVHEEEHHQEASNTHTSITLHNDTELGTSSYQDNDLLEPIKNSSDIQTSVRIESSLQTILENDDTLTNLLANHLLSENTDYPPKPFELYNPDSTGENFGQISNKGINENAQATNNALFTPSTLDYSSWLPSLGTPITSMVPPPVTQNTWVSANNFSPFTTKRPKQIQIIVPYTINNNKEHLQNNDWIQSETTGQESKSSAVLSKNIPDNPSLSLFTKLPTMEESQWTKYMDHNFQETQEVVDTTETLSPIANIKDFFQNSNINIENTERLPFDIIKLQKNIDVWTEQEYNKMQPPDANKSSTSSRFAYSKKIPPEYLTTPSLDITYNEVTSAAPNLETKHYLDYLASGTFQHLVESEPRNLTELLNIGNQLIETNLIGSDLTTTQKPEEFVGTALHNLTVTETPEQRNATVATWDKIQVSISPLTNEKIYVVTPQPWNHDTSTPASAWMYVPKKEIQEINKQLAQKAHYVFSSPRFSIRPEPAQLNKTKELDTNQKIHFVYSDWPDLINNLATTTTEKEEVTQHPLLGKMDISSLTTSAGSVQTYVGHSRVASAVTASSIFPTTTERNDKKL